MVRILHNGRHDGVHVYMYIREQGPRIDIRAQKKWRRFFAHQLCLPNCVPFLERYVESGSNEDPGPEEALGLERLVNKGPRVLDLRFRVSNWNPRLLIAYHVQRASRDFCQCWSDRHICKFHDNSGVCSLRGGERHRACVATVTTWRHGIVSLVIGTSNNCRIGSQASTLMRALLICVGRTQTTLAIGHTRVSAFHEHVCAYVWGGAQDVG